MDTELSTIAAADLVVIKAETTTEKGVTDGDRDVNQQGE